MKKWRNPGGGTRRKRSKGRSRLCGKIKTAVPIPLWMVLFVRHFSREKLFNTHSTHEHKKELIVVPMKYMLIINVESGPRNRGRV